MKRSDFEELVSRDREVEIRTRSRIRLIWHAFWAIVLLALIVSTCCIWNQALRM